MSSRSNGTQFDVAIIGAGMGGSMLGAALARNGVRVLLIDGASHPRFAVGEATIPYTNVTQRIIAARYNVPELTKLCTLKDITEAIGPSFGTKTHFGFLRHEEGKPQNPMEVNEFHTPGLLHEAHHLFRQDTDAWVFQVAVSAGCTPRMEFRVTDIDFDDSGVTIRGADGEEHRVRYVVDASGFRSPLAQKFGLREDPPRYKHHSRSMFTHMIGVTHTDDLWQRSPADTPPIPWYGGTVHHTFDRGWFWVIGFDNTPYSRNPLTSVGLTLDERLYPKDPSMSPEEDFWYHATRFPDVERQYAGGTAVREWVSTGRVQYSSTTTVGDRWCLLGHAAAFIDPLFSFGLANTGDAVNHLAWRLIRAVRDDDFSAERFAWFDQWQQARYDYNDEMVNAGFTSFDHFELWKAVFRIWVWGDNAGTFRLRKALTEFEKSGKDEVFQDLEKAPHLGFDWPVHDGYRRLYDQMVEQCDLVQAKKITPDEASAVLWSELRACNFMPKPFGYDDPSVRFMSPRPKVLAKTALWAMREADPAVRHLMLSNGRKAIKQRLKGDRIF